MGENLKTKKIKLKMAQNKTEEATAASSSAPPPPWIELPRELTVDILHRLSPHEILENAQRVCKTWRIMCKDPSMWRVIDMRILREHLDLYPHLETLCRHAVDRSEGQLTHIYIDYLATDGLLHYIYQRSSQVKFLQLRGCDDVSGDGLSEAAKRFPLLEELHFVYMQYCNKDIEAIGRSCPKLRSFTLSESSCPRPPFSPSMYESNENALALESNENALAIAKSMPGLHQLRLLGSNMTNVGLEAILDGCPLLESLDIRNCDNVDLCGDLGKKIAQKIKHFKHPSDPMEDSEWSTEAFDYYEDYELYRYSDAYYDELLDTLVVNSYDILGF